MAEGRDEGCEGRVQRPQSGGNGPLRALAASRHLNLYRSETDAFIGSHAQVPKESCSYMLDLTYPHRSPASREPWTTSIPLVTDDPQQAQTAASAVQEAIAEPVQSGESAAKGLFGGLRRALSSNTGSSSEKPAITLEPSLASSLRPGPKGPPETKVEKVFCSPFLDNAESSRLTRTLWMPFKDWQAANRWGELCLLKRA